MYKLKFDTKNLVITKINLQKNTQLSKLGIDNNIILLCNFLGFFINVLGNRIDFYL